MVIAFLNNYPIHMMQTVPKANTNVKEVGVSPTDPAVDLQLDIMHEKLH